MLEFTPTVDAEQKQPEPQLTYPEAELVLGLVYPAGTDYTGVQLTLENYIKRFNYRPNPIRLSEFIDKILKKINVGVPLDDSNEAARINSRMTAGNKIVRESRG